MSIVAASIYFVACHAGPAGHFTEFAKSLREDGYHVEILATGPALAKFSAAGISVREFHPYQYQLDAEATLAQDIARSCSEASVVITDVGDLLMREVHRALDSYPLIHYAYYDNPEKYVPGGYSETAAQVIEASQGVVFANAKLASELDFGKKSWALGYYPVEHAKAILKLREQKHLAFCAEYLAQHGIVDAGQKIAVYFGGNNREYYESAFPRFLQVLEGVVAKEPHLNVILHQHPGAKKEHLDADMATKWMATHPGIVRISEISLDEALLLADVAVYFQTSMNLEFFIARIPQIIQVADHAYEDILIRNHLAPSVSDAQGFLKALHVSQNHLSDAAIEEMVGMGNWKSNLRKMIQNSIHKP